VKTDENVKEVSSLNSWELILAGIRRHSSVPKLVTNGCLALAAIVEADGKCLQFMLQMIKNLHSCGSVLFEF